jgi:hypothetical protein
MSLCRFHAAPKDDRHPLRQWRLKRDSGADFRNVFDPIYAFFDSDRIAHVKIADNEA